jgi:hypothetical protein
MFKNLWKWYNAVAHRAIIGSDPREKNILRPGSCGGSYFQQTDQEFDRLVTYINPPGSETPPKPQDSQTGFSTSPATASYQAQVGSLRDKLRQKYEAGSLTWDDLYGFQIALLPLYPQEELRVRRSSLKDKFYQTASKHSVESYERTSPPPLAGALDYQALLADAIFLQTELSKIETYRPHQEFKRNRITLDLFASLFVTLGFYLIGGTLASIAVYIFDSNHPIVFPCLVLAMMLGALGAVVSSQRRLQASFDEDASILNTTRYVGSGLGTRLTPVLGSIFAGVLFVLIYSGLFSTAASIVIPVNEPSRAESAGPTPSSSVAPSPSPTPAEPVGSNTTTEFRQFVLYGPKKYLEYAKILVFAFLAGFAERLVPDTLDRLSLNSRK